jgi:hypothetical protein
MENNYTRYFIFYSPGETFSFLTLPKFMKNGSIKREKNCRNVVHFHLVLLVKLVGFKSFGSFLEMLSKFMSRRDFLGNYSRGARGKMGHGVKWDMG